MTLSESLVRVARHLNKSFVLKGEPIAYQDVFSPAGLLPGFAKRAEQVANLCQGGDSLGARYEEDESTLLGVSVSFDQQLSDQVRLFYFLDTLLELIDMSPDPNTIALDELMY